MRVVSRGLAFLSRVPLAGSGGKGPGRRAWRARPGLA